MSLRWYVNRLRSMSVPEIAFRVRERVAMVTARGRLDDWARYPAEGTAAPVIPGLRAALDARADEMAARRIAVAAQSLLAGEYATLSVTWPRRDPARLFDPEIWRLDPVSGETWPGSEKFSFDIAYRHERRLGDIKYVWEFNRLQFLQTLAAHVALEGDREGTALAAIEDAVESWYEANPPYRGVAWNSGIELALRSISLLIVTSLCADRLSTDTIVRIRRILRAQGAWMKRFPSRFSSANNHLVAEAAGEFLIGLCFSTCAETVAEAAALETGGRRILEAEAEKQILADGVPAEQSPTYGAFTAEFLLLCLRAADAAGRPLAPAVGERLTLFANFIATLADGRGEVPAIGDDDEGKVVAPTGEEHRYAAAIASAILAGTGQGTRTAAEAGGLRALLLGAADLPDRSGGGLVQFPEGGYSVVRERRAGRALALVLDHGPLGYLSIAAHGHADALAVTLTLDDVPVFVDPGTYLYHAGGKWRSLFRGTLAHNTLALDETDQSIISGPFNWSHKAHARLDEAAKGAQWSLRASHDGYVGRFGVRHERAVAATPDGFRITDRLVGTPCDASVAVSFVLAPGCVARREEGMVIVQLPEGRPVTLSCNHPDGLAVLGPETEQAWHSSRFGEKHPTTAIRWSGVRMPEALVFDIRL
ncbi:heparinase II/III family protein [Methylobacterium sp. ID0610]|uniref:heparinase II/III family protein n=1 Tax=Methylobacterium carpenticola TaxID=3344827 RepID=UPI0036CD20FE